METLNSTDESQNNGSEINQGKKKENIYWIHKVLTNAKSNVVIESKVVRAWEKRAGDAGGRNDKRAKALVVGRRMCVRRLDCSAYISHGYV